MIVAAFSVRGPDARFTVRGHAGYAPHGEDIVCAAASSAGYLVANTATEIFGVKAEITEEDGVLSFSETGNAEAAKLVRGLMLHFSELSQQYPQFVKVITED